MKSFLLRLYLNLIPTYFFELTDILIRNYQGKFLHTLQLKQENKIPQGAHKEIHSRKMLTNTYFDLLNFNNKGTIYSKLIPKLYKRFGKTIMITAEKI